MDKYYEPIIEEFHVGFEYEYLNPNGQWVNHILGSSPIIHNELDQFKDDLMKLAHAVTRVKYLDKEGIESLKWNTTSSETNYRHFINRTKSEFDTPQIVLECIDLHEHIYDIFNLINEGGKRFIVFRGQIKNKGELKVLMKQLNIIK